MSDIVIRAEHLSKMYRLGVINNGTLWKDLQTWVALKTGKEDPHSKIGEDKYAGDKDHFWALKDLNFEIKRGDRVGIIGKNGAGKSTLLKILSRITAPTEGRIKIKGKVASLLEVGTGFHGELTGRENIYLNGAILGMKKRQIDRKLDEIIDFSGIEHHIDTPVKRYSSGMYVRLAFAVAAHLDSDILIADEVLAVGDAEFQKKALGKMQDLSTGQGRTVLFVSHNIVAVNYLCNVGILLENGRIKFSGSTDQTIQAYNNEVVSQIKYLCKDIITNIPQIRRVSFVDYDLKDVVSCFSGEDINILIEAFSPDQQEFEFTLSFWDHQKRPLWNFTHAMYGFEPIKRSGISKTLLTFKPPILTVPEIFVHVAIGPKGGFPFYENLVDVLKLSILDRQRSSNFVRYSEWPILCGANIKITTL